MSTSSDIILKTILVGLGAVGKTSICKRLDGEEWSPQYTTTIGMNLFNYTMTIDNKGVETIIYDTGGQQLFQALNKFFYRGAIGAVIVYDIANRDSFDSIPTWISTIRRESGVVPLLIVGNKSDLERVVKLSEVEEMVKDLDWQVDNNNSIFNQKDLPVKCVETSAKESDKGIIDMFEGFVKELYELTIE